MVWATLILITLIGLLHAFTRALNKELRKINLLDDE